MFKVFDEYESEYVYNTYFNNCSDICEDDIRDVNVKNENVTEFNINRALFSVRAVAMEFGDVGTDKSLLWFQLAKYPEIFKDINLQLISNFKYFNKSSDFKYVIEFFRNNFEEYKKISMSIESVSLNKDKIDILVNLGFSEEIVYKDELGKGNDLIVYSMSI